MEYCLDINWEVYTPGLVWSARQVADGFQNHTSGP